MTNPYDAIWGYADPQFVSVDSGGTFDRNISFFYVHGAFYNGGPNVAFDDFAYLENGVGLFRNAIADTSPTGEVQTLCPEWGKKQGYVDASCPCRCRLFILGYDTSLSTAAKGLINKAIGTVLGGSVTGSSDVLNTAVAWREMERRGAAAGDYLAGLLSQIDDPYFSGEYHMFSHSLGCFTVAHAAQAIYTAHPDWPYLFVSWYCMAGAVPADAFAPTGRFPQAPKLIPSVSYLGDGWGQLKVYYSLVDDVLSAAYMLAAGQPAMGQFGSTSQPAVANFGNVDTRTLTGAIHGPFGYLQPVAPLMRTDYGISNTLAQPGTQSLGACGYTCAVYMQAQCCLI